MNRLIVIYILATFLFAIPYTIYSAGRDNTTTGIGEAVMRTGRVNLLRSYWYERYAPRDLFCWCVANSVAINAVGVVDKAAFIVYAREYGVTLTGTIGPPINVLAAYFKIGSAGGIKKLYPPGNVPNFMGIYEVTR